MKNTDPLGIPKAEWGGYLIGYKFPEARPIFWGADHYITDSTYVEPTGWKYNEYLSIPYVVRFLHDSGTTESDTADGGDGGGGDPPDPEESAWELYATCVQAVIGNGPALLALPFGAEVFYGNKADAGPFACTGITPPANEPIACSPAGYEQQFAESCLILPTVNQCEFYNASLWYYRGTVGGAIAVEYLRVIGYTTTWHWRKLVAPLLYDYISTEVCPDIPGLSLTSSPKTTPTTKQEHPWVPDSALPNCVPP